MNKEIASVVSYALNKGFQIHPDAFKILENVRREDLEKVIREIVKEKSKQNLFIIDQDDLEGFFGLKNNEELDNDHQILQDPTTRITSAEGIGGYNQLFSNRFSKLKKIISNRPEAKNLKKIESIITQKPTDDVFVCGLLTERKNEKSLIKLQIDDTSASIEGLVFDTDLQKKADVLLMDQFVMLKLSLGKNGGFIVKDIILPDIPDHVGNRSKTEAYVVFLSDFHIGSKFFLEQELLDFVSWLSEPDPIAQKIRFVVIGGDVIDGVGIYPNQDKELVFPSVEEQLEKAFEIIEKIPKKIKVFVIPGNHDPGRRALPQPAIPKKYCSKIWEAENIFMVGNPGMISLNGVKVLMFHGQSIDDVVKTTAGLSYDNPTNVMRSLLQARHLSPIFGSSTPIAPETEDMMVIDDVPDIFLTGHVHTAGLDLYKGILLVNPGTWQKQTPFQASVGITPAPGMAIITNLKTFKVYRKNFGVG